MLLFVGPVRCSRCTCYQCRDKPIDAWKWLFWMDVFISIPVLIWSLLDLTALYPITIQTLLAIYLIVGSVIGLRNKGAESADLPRCRAEYYYIIFAVGAIAAVPSYMVVYPGCERADLDGCPFPQYFNHNAVLHCVYIVILFIFFFGVLTEQKSDQKGNNDVVSDVEKKQHPKDTVNSVCDVVTV